MARPEQTRSHLWIVGSTRRDRAAVAHARTQAPDPVVGTGTGTGIDIAVDCHRGLRGPYTGAGSLLRALIPGVAAADPGLPAAYAPAILCAAPELEPLVGSAPETLTSLAPQDERTRWYSLQRTLRIANSLVELLHQCGARRAAGITVFFDAVDQADPTDREFLAIALRRLDPAGFRILVGSGSDPDGQAGGDLARRLARHALRVDAPAAEPRAAAQATAAELARAYVAEDGAGDDPATLAAYTALSEAQRVQLHDARAEELEAAGEFSLRLGAIAHHRFHGSDPIGTAWPLYAGAEGYCMSMGYYHAVLDCLDRLEELARGGGLRQQHLQQHSGIRRGQILALMGDPGGGEAQYLRALALTRVPRQVMSLHYALGMLYTRWRPEDRRDHDLATAHLNTAVAIAVQLEGPADRSFYTAFMSNGLALARMHAGRLDEALELVEGALELLDRELVADKHLLHRSVLRHNRAQLLSALGRRAEALADLDEVVGLDPQYPEYYFDRGNLRFQQGDAAGALADYARAEALAPPFPELYHNRAEVLTAAGDPAGAARALRRALALDPADLESTISLASLLLDAGPDAQPPAAETGTGTGADPGAVTGADPVEAVLLLVREGLDSHPDQPRLLCLLGRALAEAGREPEAVAAFDAALLQDPDLYQALASRAVLAFNAARHADALADLDLALAAAGDHPDLLYNRGAVHEALGDPRAALQDYQRALTLPDCDTQLLQERVAECRLAFDQAVAR